ncbi:MAG: hypothetical protein OEO23_10640 [Gemmatimonadota bacterium]|nr:hypothetical protein [Gemmatimonadota bacterium]
MSRWLRRIRGAVGMGLTWAAAWFGAGMIMMLGLLLLTGSTGADVPYPLGFGALGFVGGVAFSGVLGLIEGRRRFDQMSLPRFAGWGAAGGLLLSTVFVLTVTFFEDPTFWQNLVVLGPVFAAAGAGSAAGWLALARKAEEGDLLGPGDGTARGQFHAPEGHEPGVGPPSGGR